MIQCDRLAYIGNSACILSYHRMLLVPFPLLDKVTPVSLRLLHSVASTLDEVLGDRTGLVDQAQTPRGDWPSLDGVRGEKR